MGDGIRCPSCGSTNVECVSKPHHDHICHDCGHTVLPQPKIAGEGTEAPCVPPRASDAEASTEAPLPGPDISAEPAFCWDVDGATPEAEENRP